MALSSASLSSKFKTQLEAIFGSPVDATKLQQFCDAMAAAVVSEIKTNAVVTTTGTVTSGAGAGGAVTASGTVS